MTSGTPFTQQTKAASSEKLANELRDSINGSLINVGVLAALMMALAGAIYVDPPEPPGRCHGEPMLMAEMVIVWMAMGFFFFSTISSVVLYMDLDGIPSDMLLCCYTIFRVVKRPIYFHKLPRRWVYL